MFILTYQNIETGEVVVEDKDFGLIYKFIEDNYLTVNIENEYDLVFIKKDGTTKKIIILP